MRLNMIYSDNSTNNRYSQHILHIYVYSLLTSYSLKVGITVWSKNYQNSKTRP